VSRARSVGVADGGKAPTLDALTMPKTLTRRVAVWFITATLAQVANVKVFGQTFFKKFAGVWGQSPHGFWFFSPI